MKAKQKQQVGTHPKTQSGTKLTYQHRCTFMEATCKFIAKCPRPDDGRNHHIVPFCEAMDRIVTLQKTFVLSDVLRECSNREIPHAQARELFSAWLTTMEGLQKIQPLGNFIYDEETFLVLN